MGIFILATLRHWYSRHQSRIYVPFSFYSPFRSVFTEFFIIAQVRLLIQQLLAFAHRVIFSTSLVRGRLLAQNKVQYIAKACSYNISKNLEELLGAMLVPSVINWWHGVWLQSITCRLYLWLLNSYKHGTWIVV